MIETPHDFAAAWARDAIAHARARAINDRHRDDFPPRDPTMRRVMADGIPEQIRRELAWCRAHHGDDRARSRRFLLSVLLPAARQVR